MDYVIRFRHLHIHYSYYYHFNPYLNFILRNHLLLLHTLMNYLINLIYRYLTHFDLISSLLIYLIYFDAHFIFYGKFYFIIYF